MDKIVQMEGFEKLTEAQQLQVLNHERNFVGLSESANTSKGAKTFEEWTEHKGLGIKVDESFRQKMMSQGREAESELQNLIKRLSTPPID